MHMIAVAFALTIILLTSGCSKNENFGQFISPTADKFIHPASVKETISDVSNFHRMLDAGQFHEIYQAADADLKKSTSEKNFVALLESVHDQLGNYKAGSLTGLTTKSHSYSIETFSISKSTITLTYMTDFEKGKATEKFVFVDNDSHPLLDEYHIDSSLLNHT